MIPSGGWGDGGWGDAAWGIADTPLLALISGVAVRENVVRLGFNASPRRDWILGPHDASSPARYSVVGLAGARPVSPALVSPGPADRHLDLGVDRPLSGHPASYLVSVNGLASVDGSLLDPAASSILVLGLSSSTSPTASPPSRNRRDLANPQTRPGPEQVVQDLFLGTFPVDSRGDYASDDGYVNRRKRILRRLVTAPGGFAHLPGYGVGVGLHLKRIAQAGARASLCSAVVQQVSREPDVESVSCSIVARGVPSLLFLEVRVRARGTGTDELHGFPLSS